ncbi:MAG TPA: secretin N-terminal domain-containing protein [Sphingomicrobium sp.]|nr:secretin N-terminal domain-containing protein [Sphingomicrobium sp.]
MLQIVRALAHALCALLLAASLGGVASAPAIAQLRPQPVPSVLTEIKLISENPDESRFEISFDPKAPTFAPMASQQPTLPSMGFALTARGPRAVQPSHLKGLVRGLSFETVDTLLIMRFGTDRPAALSAVQTSDRTIEVTISSGRAPKLADDVVEGPVGGLPPAYAPPENFEMVMLKYADVSEVVGLLTDGLTVKSNDVFIPSEPQFGSNSLTGNSYTPPTTVSQAPGASDEPLGQSVDASIGVDRRLNAVWLKGSPEQIARMKAMIAAIDIPVDSVVLETQFVELTEQGLKAIGIDFNNANGQIGVVTLQSGQFIPPGVPAGAHLSSAQFQAALYAQIQKGNGRIVSRPRISAQSGSTAKIITGDALPILTSIALSGVNGVSQQVQYVNVGVTLQIAPRVSSDGWVSSHVFAVVSSVTGTSQGYPTISQREAETSATVRDGDSFVIGGLTQDETISTKSKVPLLGDIPIVGEAFRNERTTRSKTELYIIVTPHIVHRVGTRTEAASTNAAVYAPTTTTTIPIVPDPPRRHPENR